LRANPLFLEWAMGLDEGWVTAPGLGLSQTAQATALGNGVVPAQAALALGVLRRFAENPRAGGLPG
jgi:DNA (cytosine-5)-methyltransferase 1